jgi:hypothetical protein
MSGDAEHWEYLATPLGLPGSGRVRYAAAMSLYACGALSAELLEAYRVCCKDDGRDPTSVLAPLHAPKSRDSVS